MEVGVGMGSSPESTESSRRSPDRPGRMGMSAAVKSAAETVRRMAEKILSRLIAWLEKRIPAHSAVGMDPMIAHEGFPWAGTLERNWQQIRGELDELMAHFDALPNIQDIATDQYGLTQDDKGKS